MPVETTKGRKRESGNELSSEVVRRHNVAGIAVLWFDSRRLHQYVRALSFENLRVFCARSRRL